MKDLKPIIAQNIVCLRQAQGWTQIQLAEKLNYSDKAVSKWERAESVPDIGVLKQLADLFHVSVDDLLQPPQEKKKSPLTARLASTHMHGWITGISILLVWLIATLLFVLLELILGTSSLHGLVFVPAIPITMIVWLIFNSIYFNRRRNYLIISFLMWSVLFCAAITALPFRIHLWIVFLAGIPGQAIIIMWSRIKGKRNRTE